jgi:hypothetical protein
LRRIEAVLELDGRLTTTIKEIGEHFQRLEQRVAQLEADKREVVTEARAAAATAVSAVAALHTADLARQIGILQEQVRMLREGAGTGRRAIGGLGGGAQGA